MQGEKGLLEFLAIGDYGKDSNIKADFLGITRELNGVPNGEIMPLSEKLVVTISTQYGCSMGCKFCDVPKVGKGINATYHDMLNQILLSLKLYPELTGTKRLNIHFARMGEPTFNGYLIDIGPHRFFSKSDRVNDFWSEVLGEKSSFKDKHDWLEVNRLTRIFYLKKFFNYPIKLSYPTLVNLGPKRIFKIGLSYGRSRLRPIAPEESLADFYINRFGRELYKTFFKDYTEKVWGVPCEKIPPDWGGQRVKGLSITRVIKHAALNLIKRSDKKSETSLIEKFQYPRYGAGQMYQAAAELIEKMGGKIELNRQLISFNLAGERKLNSVIIKNLTAGSLEEIKPDYIVSSMPVKELIAGFNGPVPEKIKEVQRSIAQDESAFTINFNQDRPTITFNIKESVG
jgi:protoporphyrinogen oxidase